VSGHWIRSHRLRAGSDTEKVPFPCGGKQEPDGSCMWYFQWVDLVQVTERCWSDGTSFRMGLGACRVVAMEGEWIATDGHQAYQL